MLIAALVLAAQAQDLPEPATILQTGFSSREARSAFLTGPPADPAARTMLAAGALAPERVCGLPPLAGEERARALRLALDGFLAGAVDEPEPVRERLRGWLDRPELERLAEEARAGSAPARRLLLAAPAPDALDLWAALALDRSVAEEARSDFLAHWIPAGGRPALERALEPILSDPSPFLARRLLGLWRPLLEPCDAARLRQVSTDPRASVADTALPMWARLERDPERRRECFERALERPSGLRLRTLRALATGGPAPDLAARLAALLDGPDRELHDLAAQVLPAFMPAPDLAALLLERLPPPDRPDALAPAIAALARVDAPASHRRAAAWLADGGWAEPRFGAAVARALSTSPEVDPFLGRLFADSRVPPEVARPLALGRASASPEARLWLRRTLPDSTALEQEQAVRALAEAGHPDDLALLQEIASEPGWPAPARAAALEGIARLPEGRPWLLELLEGAPVEYEVRAALIRGLIEHGDHHQRRIALRRALDDASFSDPDYRLGLRLAALAATEAMPRPADAPLLAEELARELRRAPDLFPTGLPDPRRAAAALPAVHAAARALRRCLEAGGLLPELDLEGATPAALLHACSVLAPAAPARIQLWSRNVAERSDLDPSLRLRAQALAARAAILRGSDSAVAALEALLRRPDVVLAHPWDLAFGLGAEDSRMWVLPIDRLHEERILARAAAAGGAERADLLRSLLPGAAAPPNLVEAGRLALAGGDPALAAELGRRAAALAPTEPGPRQLLAAAARAAGDLEQAARHEAAVRRLTPGSG
ncbi:MAG: hypothetical protein D6702_08060 [Planctomycetota bacterium]|nr:MAG: hypothetical protein D6702_08060 [Planctomycetota bacterium]